MRALPALLLLACLDFPAQTPCVDDDDCSEAVCVDGVCTEADFQCGFGFSVGDACGDCLGERCCDEAEACHGDPDCTSIFDCLARCSFEGRDVSCLSMCEAHGRGSPAAADLLGCMGSRCADGCGACGPGSHLFSPECGECILRSAPVCDAMSSCLDDPGCWDVFACVFGCTDPACIDACALLDITGAELLAGSRGTANVSCGQACETGRNWSCVDTYSWGLSEVGAVVTVSLLAVPTLPDAAVRSIRARACSLFTETCGEPVAAEGAELAMPIEVVRDAGFVGFFEVEGDTTAGPIVPTIASFGHPVVTASALSVLVAPEQGAAAIASLAGVDLDFDRAQIIVTAYDCEASLAPGVSFSLAEGRRADGPFYPAEAPISREAKTTDGRGVGVFFNVPVNADGPDLVTIRASHEGAIVGSSLVRVRAGSITVANIFPTAPGAN